MMENNTNQSSTTSPIIETVSGGNAPENELRFASQAPMTAEMEAEIFKGVDAAKVELPFQHETHEALVQHEPLIRDFLSKGGFPDLISKSLASTINEVTKMHEQMNDGEVELYQRNQRTILQTLWGAEYEAKLQIAKAYALELDKKSPGYLDLIDATGAGDNAQVVANFYLQAERQKIKR